MASRHHQTGHSGGKGSQQWVWLRILEGQGCAWRRKGCDSAGRNEVRPCMACAWPERPGMGLGSVGSLGKSLLWMDRVQLLLVPLATSICYFWRECSICASVLREICLLLPQFRGGGSLFTCRSRAYGRRAVRGSRVKGRHLCPWMVYFGAALCGPGGTQAVTRWQPARRWACRAGDGFRCRVLCGVPTSTCQFSEQEASL
jgi:hypothetical protein